jgi:hypothetical protein
MPVTLLWFHAEFIGHAMDVAGAVKHPDDIDAARGGQVEDQVFLEASDGKVADPAKAGFSGSYRVPMCG